MKSWAPSRKVNAGIVAGALQAAFVWWWNGTNRQPILTGEVASAVIPVVTYIVSWLIPDKYEDGADEERP